ncbi:Abi family protein [Granulosicoccus antarcticus]|uniref:Abi-like protein n=1 Tax=Granulosicoccus antarcticus IMCC3135 TaxID=1192854 RepID=A0A2Z2NWM4_9GAMM|nr:Abi family protein [Granulosicoccus antarcticus]ASJ75749.1 hypothetical protein IMCC3135_28485 [Granulosicoccus antarcticus IMCC3135]
MDYSKPALSFKQQVALLSDRGLTIGDSRKAEIFLSHTNYYRLAAYTIPYQIGNGNHQFVQGTHLDRIIADYEFDRSLRLLLLDAIERMEVSLRAHWAYFMGHKFGAHGYAQYHKRIYKNQHRLNQSLSELEAQVDRSSEPFIAHYKNTYSESLPPAWVVCEVMSLGLLSKMYSNLSAYTVRREISAIYKMDEGFLEGFLEHLSYVRNVCAHHGRVWNRHLMKKMPLPRGKPAGLRDNINVEAETEHKIYNTLVLLMHCISVVSMPCSHWCQKLESLLDDFDMDITAMGFPPDWKDRPLWKLHLNGDL